MPAGSREDQNYPGYHLKLDVEVQNTGDAAADRSPTASTAPPACRSKAGGTRTRSASDWFSAAGLRDVVVRFAGQRGAADRLLANCRGQSDQPMGQGTSLAFVGVDAVYFSAVLIPVKTSLDEVWFDIDRSDSRRSEAGRAHARPTSPTSPAG